MYIAFAEMRQLPDCASYASRVDYNGSRYCIFTERVPSCSILKEAIRRYVAERVFGGKIGDIDV